LKQADHLAVVELLKETLLQLDRLAVNSDDNISEDYTPLVIPARQTLVAEPLLERDVAPQTVEVTAAAVLVCDSPVG